MGKDIGAAVREVCAALLDVEGTREWRGRWFDGQIDRGLNQA